MSSYRELKKRLMKNKKVREEYEKLRAEYEVFDKIIALRMKNNMTQQELAEKLETKQPAVSRLEKKMINPTVSFLNKVASVFGKKLVVEFR